MTDRKTNKQGRKPQAADGRSRDWSTAGVDAARDAGMARDGVDALGEADVMALFALAADDAPVPSDDLMARIMGDADAVLAARAAPAVHAEVTQGRWASLRARMMEAIGGWRGATGLATAGFVGITMGLASPVSLSSMAAGEWTTSDVSYYADGEYGLDDLMPSFYDLGIEG